MTNTNLSAVIRSHPVMNTSTHEQGFDSAKVYLTIISICLFTQRALNLTERQQNNATELANQLYQAYQSGAPIYQNLNGLELVPTNPGEASAGDQSWNAPVGPHYMTNVDPYAIDRAARLHRNAACECKEVH